MHKRLVTVIGLHTARCVKVFYNPELEEYVCKLYVKDVHHEPGDYFTEDKEDALATAAAIHASM